MARLRSIRRLLRRFGQIGPRRRALMAEAALCLLAARLALAFVPFPTIARRLGRFVAPEEARRLARAPTAQQEQAAAAIPPPSAGP
jgi:hypothetical protein